MSKREALRGWLMLPPMVTRERARRVGAFRVSSYRVWSRPPVRDARFLDRDECARLTRAYARRGGWA